MEFSQARILIFAKPPIAGYCKTRLGRRIGMQPAASIHRALIHRTATTVCTASLAPAALHCDGSTAHPLFHQLRRQHHLPLQRQCPGDLGERMLYAARSALRGSSSVLIIGTDCPVLTPDHLRRCLRELQGGQETVLIPSEDGGYAAIGLSKAEPLLFRAIDWGSHKVMSQTRQRLRRTSLRWKELEPLWDVDKLADYQRARRLNLI